MMISSGSSPKRMMNAEPMTPVNVKEVMACRERLGITHLWDLPGVSGSISRVCIHPREEEGIRTPFPRTLMIFPPISSDGRVSAADAGRLSRLSHRNISCAAFSEAGELPDDIMRFSEARRDTGIHIMLRCLAVEKPADRSAQGEGQAADHASWRAHPVIGAGRPDHRR